MNKSEFIKQLESKTGYTTERCALINDVLENHFVFRKKNKEKIISELGERLSVGEEEAENIYVQAMEIIKTEIKAAKRRPFGERK